MPPELILHLPFLRMTSGTPVQLQPGGCLERIAFEDWLLLEDPVMSMQESWYRDVEPIFVRIDLPGGSEPGELDSAQEELIDEIVERVHSALLLAMPGRDIKRPSLSTTYIAWRGFACDIPDDGGIFGPNYKDSSIAPEDEGIQLGRITSWLQQEVPSGILEQWVVQRRFGPAYREWLLSSYACNGYVLSSEDVERFALHFKRLGKAQWGKRRAAAVRCSDALQFMGMPQVETEEKIVLLVAALENIVNARAERPLGDVFAKRCAALFAKNGEERLKGQPLFRKLYSLRSEILHGGDPSAALKSLAACINEGSDDARGYADTIVAWLYALCLTAVDLLAAWYIRNPEDDGAATLFQKMVASLDNADLETWLTAGQFIAEGGIF